MKKRCGYCGRECEASATNCPIDDSPLVDVTASSMDPPVQEYVSYWRTLFDPEYPEDYSIWPNWWDRQFVQTPWWMFLAAMLCVSWPTLFGCVLGVLFCRYPVARRRAMLLVVIGVFFSVAAYFILLEWFRPRGH